MRRHTAPAVSIVPTEDIWPVSKRRIARRGATERWLSRNNRMPAREGIFPTFFLSGFECSTFLWGKEQRRRDLNAELRHYEHADEDYGLLPPLGIAVAREGIPWPLVDRGHGEYDFSIIDPFLAAQRRHNILPLWDLCHYGYPDGLDPMSDVDGF